jgi:uncharacterized repeat protein (TIGR01451 family)
MTTMKKIYCAVLSIFLLSHNTEAQNKKLWGIASGGSNGGGIIYSVNPDGSGYSVKKDFIATIPGKNPLYSQLTFYNGLFYGMTSLGGIYGLGVIFSWDPVTNQYIKLFDLNTTTGSQPFGSLTVYNNKLYGMTNFGGANSVGTIFEFDLATNSFTKKIDLSTANGCTPYGSLLLVNNIFYGMTSAGGNFSKGVIFSWNPATNIYSRLFDFSGINGNKPFGSLTLFNGKLYGMTNLGGVVNGNSGIIFEFDPVTTNYLAKHEFNGPEGLNPNGSLTIYNNKLYGMTRSGGSSSVGALFEFDPATSVFTKKIDFTSVNSTPLGDLTVLNGKLFGLTSGGTTSKGTAFRWDPVSNVIQIAPLNENTGYTPQGTFSIFNDKLYGMTFNGGKGGGTILEMDPLTGDLNKRIDFQEGADGLFPQAGPLQFFNGKLYGAAITGGSSGGGTLFEYDIATNVFSKKFDFDRSSFYGPSAKLELYHGKFYSTAFNGGSLNTGVLYEYDPTTSIVTKKIDLDPVATGFVPMSFNVFNDTLYGIMNSGGINNRGVIFKYDPATNVYTKKIDLSSALSNGIVRSGMTLFNGKFYGLMDGGNFNQGFIFEYNPSTNIIIKKYDLSGLDGSTPRGDMIVYQNKLYGTTFLGGANNKGVLFAYDPVSNTYSRKVDFSSNIGINPTRYSLIVNGNKIYGTTQAGGAHEGGVIFEYNQNTNNISTLYEFNSQNGQNGITPFSLVETGIQDLSVSLVPITPARPGFNVQYKLIYKNEGTETITSGAVQLIKSNNLTFVSSSPVNQTISGNTIIWAFSNLKSGETGNILINFTVGIPPVVNLGDTLISQATVTPSVNDETPNDSTAILKQLVVGSYDPNDKREIHGGKISLPTFSDQQWQTYTIRFQNTGTASATNISVKDTLDSKMDWNSFEMVDASHPYTLTNVDGNKLSWTFTGINLPDQNSDEPGSHGYIIYRLKPTLSLSAGDIIKNSAGIYFDFNLPVQTNIEQTIIEALTPLPVKMLSFSASPGSGYILLKWSTTNEIDASHFEVEHSFDGASFSGIGIVSAVNNSSLTNQYQFTHSQNKTGNHFYRLKIVDLDGKFIYSKVLKLTIGKNDYDLFSITPNPAFAKISITGNGITSITLYDIAGRLVFTKNENAVLSTTLDISALTSGIYTVWVQSADGRQQSKKLVIQ